MRKISILLFCLFQFLALPVTEAKQALEGDEFVGRWDMIVFKDGKEIPSWLEISRSGYYVLVGRFVYIEGSARPISEVKIKDGKFNFSIPAQWEDINRYIDFEGEKDGDDLKGTMVFVDGQTYPWKASRAPVLPYNDQPEWGKPIKLFNGKDLSGWQIQEGNQWIVEKGILKSPVAGINLISEQKFTDFKLRAEFRYPENGNSGLYLRGRYEVQIADNKGQEPSSILFGGVYGFLTPNQMMAQEPGEWQTLDITLIGNRVTIVANGIAVITDQIIPGITGGALDCNEGEPGPIMIQGDHEPVEFKNITIMPIK